MPSRLTEDQLRAYAQDYANLIKAGWPPTYDRVAAQRMSPTTLTKLREIWGVTHNDSVRRRLRAATDAGLDWIWRQHLPDTDSATQDIDPPSIEERIEEHRLQAENTRLRAENKALLEQIAGAQDFSAALAGLSDPLEPVTFQKPGQSAHAAETVILFLSDLQWGEKVDIGVMDGLNAYNVDIAGARIQRVFNTAIDFMTDHWPNKAPKPARIILILGGDMISGEIHEELAKTNTLLSIPALRDCAAHICAGIRALRDAIKRPIDIISVPGNHGRMTKKTESKLYAAHSFDTLLADLVELEFATNGKWPSWFRMYKPFSGDALIWIYGYRFLITHGDRIGSRGGQGFVGTAATVARGFKKLVMDYAGRGITLDFIMCGHFHTALQLEEGICNGSLPGPSEYSRDLRFRPRPCVQAFLTVHPRHGVTQLRWINAGDPSEGELYAPKEPPADGGKLRFRIPAVGEAL